MKIKLICGLILMIAALVCLTTAQEIKGTISGGTKPRIGVPDFRGSGDAQRFMDGFNQTLWNELSGSGALTMVAKSVYPLNIPQQPKDFRPPSGSVSNGPWLTDWSNPPVRANYLAFGYTGVQEARIVLSGYLYNVGQPDPSSAQVIGKLYYGSLDAEGAKKVAREFAADILQQFGAQSLDGSKIYFVSDRTGNKEIW